MLPRQQGAIIVTMGTGAVIVGTEAIAVSITVAMGTKAAPSPTLSKCRPVVYSGKGFINNLGGVGFLGKNGH